MWDKTLSLNWEHLGILQNELENIAEEKDVWNNLLSLIQLQLSRWMDGYNGVSVTLKLWLFSFPANIQNTEKVYFYNLNLM